MTLEEYEKHGSRLYARLAETVAAILESALKRHPEIRLQQCQHRAKDVASLRKKLAKNGPENTAPVEAAVKDLGGCRLIFYTNSDVGRFIDSGIISDCFEIDRIRTKFHQPDPRDDGSGNLFTSDNYVVSLKDDRAGLHEYAEVAGLWCEVQVQTTLNHAWSEMEHDIIYKPPKLEGFGGEAMEGINRRMRAIMVRYLIPAGHEFAKVDYDFQRLSQGLELFDRGALHELAEAPDNNGRFDILERFVSYVLPNYDDVAGVYPEVREALAAAVQRARETLVAPIQTQFGLVAGHTADDIEQQAATVFERLRYVDVEKTFDTVCDLYLGAPTEGSQKLWAGIVAKLASHELAVWREAGPAVQDRLVKHMMGLTNDRREALRPVLVAALGSIVSADVSGTSSTHDTVTIQQGSVFPSPELRQLRRHAIDLLIGTFENAGSIAERRTVTAALAQAMRQPYHGSKFDELPVMILEDAAYIIDFYTRVGPGIPLQLRQSLEHDLFYLFWRMGDGSTSTAEAIIQAGGRLNEAILRFRDAVNVDPEFTTYKVLVGFESVFPDAWERGDIDFEADEAFRKGEAERLVGEVTAETRDAWLERLQLFAATESDDLATFPTFGHFLRQIGQEKADIAFAYLDEIEGPLEAFIPAFLNGIAQGPRAGEGRSLAARWIAEGRYIGGVMRHYMSNMPSADALRDGLAAAIAAEHHAGVLDAVSAVAEHHAAETAELIDDILLPATAYLSAKGLFGWTFQLSFASRSLLLGDLSPAQAHALLDQLVPMPKLGFRVEDLLVKLTAHEPAAFLDFFEKRLTREKTDSEERFEAVPYRFERIKVPPVPAVMAVERTFAWYRSDKLLFPYRGGRVLANLYPTFSEELQEALLALLVGDQAERFEFVLRLLRGYSGEEFLWPICKAVVQKLPQNDELLSEVKAVVFSTGVVSGEFGMADAYAAKQRQLAPWLEDEDANVRAFAKSTVGDLERAIASERRRAEEERQLRRRNYESPDDEG
jgi:ppGpp synthetase/RelA/SpoT-type nucleotidyltranferase